MGASQSSESLNKDVIEKYQQLSEKGFIENVKKFKNESLKLYPILEKTDMKPIDIVYFIEKMLPLYITKNGQIGGSDADSYQRYITIKWKSELNIYTHLLENVEELNKELNKESLTDDEKQIVNTLINAFKDQKERFNNYVILEDTTSMTPSEIGYFVDVIIPNYSSIDSLIYSSIDVRPIKQRAIMDIFTNLLENNEKIKKEIAKLQPITTGGVKKKGYRLKKKVTN
jgi:hypothetical protein